MLRNCMIAASNTWRPTGESEHNSILSDSAVLLQNGKVLAIGLL